MALVTCKECGEEISTKAEKCPKCGAPIKKKTSFFTWLVTIFLALWFIGYIAGNPNTTKTSTTYTSISKPAEKVIEVSIRNLLAAYKNNEVGADNQYKGKMIKVTGVVNDIKKDILNNSFVTLGTGVRFEIPQIQAFFDDSLNNQLAQLRKGQKLTVVCRIDGLMMNVLAKDCTIK